jgi:hypothetical protein
VVVTWRVQKHHSEPIEVVGVIPAHEVRWRSKLARLDLDSLRPLTARLSNNVVSGVVYRGPESWDTDPDKSIQDQRLSGVALLPFNEDVTVICYAGA